MSRQEKGAQALRRCANRVLCARRDIRAARIAARHRAVERTYTPNIRARPTRGAPGEMSRCHVGRRSAKSSTPSD